MFEGGKKFERITRKNFGKKKKKIEEENGLERIRDV